MRYRDIKTCSQITRDIVGHRDSETIDSERYVEIEI